jgi:PAS domain-containing protein
MRIRDEIRLGVGVLLAVQVLTMVAAVALLARMTPAIGVVLEENERSIRAVERMMLALSEPMPGPGEADFRRVHFERALEEAEGNITEPAEGPVIERITEYYDAALGGDGPALAAVRTDLWTLGDINRQSMLRANEQAKLLGTAGAWVLVFFGLLGLVLSIAVMRRARIKLIRPIYELEAMLRACSAGDSHRRFSPGDTSKEFHEVAAVVNTLVTEHFSQRERDWESIAKLDRVALVRLLDAQREPTLVCEVGGSIAAANDAALELLAGPSGARLRDLLVRACRGEPVVGISAEPLHDAGWLCRFQAQPDGSGADGEDSDDSDSAGSFGPPTIAGAPGLIAASASSASLDRVSDPGSDPARPS